MKKIINIIKTIIDFVIDFLFLIRLLFELNYYKYDSELHTNHLRVLLQFCARSFDKSSFEYYNLNKEDNIYLFYLSLKKNNSLIFQIFCFFHCFIFNQLFYNLFWDILPNNEMGIKIRCKILNKIWDSVNEYICKQIKNNFGYEYLREYKKYYSNDKEYYNKIKYKVFFEETLINLCNLWNKFIKRFKINTDTLFFDIEKHF